MTLPLIKINNHFENDILSNYCKITTRENEICIYHEQKKVGWSIKAIFALSLPKIMTLPDQPDLRHSPLFVQVPPLFEGNSFPSREAATRNNAVYNAVPSRKPFDPREAGGEKTTNFKTKRNCHLHAGHGKPAPIPSLAQPPPRLPPFMHSFQNILSYFPYEFPFFYSSECRTIP